MTGTSTRTTIISVRLPNADADALKREADARRWSHGSVVLQALRAWLPPAAYDIASEKPKDAAQC